MPKIYIKTYGCQMNFHDTEKILALLEKHGCTPAKSPEEADFIAVNTCSVRQHAEDRALAFLSSHAPFRRHGRLLCLFGCTANLYGRDILKKHRYIDIICGAGNYGRLPEIIHDARRGVCVTGENSHPFIDEPRTVSGISEFVTVTKGCENFCSYCVVPFTRGKLVSREADAICREIRELADQEVKEIILLGQNVNEYRDRGGTAFTGLLERIQEIDGITRMWFLTSHPKDIPDELLLSFRDMPKLYKHLHLPLQSGSDRILKLMNRKYTMGRYLETVDKLRTLVPDISITSDIIAGFPSETEEDFGKTLSAVETVRFDDLFIFKYSRRPGTAAARMEGEVPQKEKERRHNLIMNVQDEISLERNRRFTGSTDSVFVIKRSSKRKGFFMGRSSSNKPVLFESAGSHPGTIETVLFSSADRRYLFGRSCGGNEKQRLWRPAQV